MHYVEFLVVKGLLKLFSKISVASGRRIAISLYFILHYVVRYRRKVIRENLYLVYGEKLPFNEKKFYREVYKNFIFLWMEFLQLNHLNRTYIDKHFRFYGIDVVERAVARGGGAIMVTGHFGNFEWEGQALGLMGYEVYGVAKRQSNARVNDLIEAIRTRPKVHVIYKSNAMQESIEALNNNGLVALISDQDAKSRGVFVDFMGIPSSTPKGAAVLHLRSGAPIIFTISLRRAYGQFDLYFREIETNGPLEVTEEKIFEITQKFSAVLECWVRKDPEQWFWMHRRWKTRPSTESVNF